MEELQKYSQKIQMFLLWWQDWRNRKQEVWPIGAYKLGQETQNFCGRSYPVQRTSIYQTRGPVEYFL